MAGYGSNLEITEHKLTILYIVQNTYIPVNNLELSDIAIECSLMNYFILQQLLNELNEDKLIIYKTGNGRRIYTLTKKGKETLDFFIDRIPAGRKKRIDEYLKEKRPSIQKKIRILSDYIPVSETEYAVKLIAREEDFTLININIMAGSKADARKICKNWDKGSDKIYQEILESLLKKRD
jgi:predicted transcriptional regulator